MFGRIRSQFQCLKGSGQKSYVCKNKTRILMFGRIRPRFNFWKNKFRIPMFERIGPEFQ